MSLLRFATAGSVDDGKSTLIGRLLYDTKSIFQDQLDSIEATSIQMGNDHTNLALLTDGLKAEREQGITIDVAYRYFSTPKRKFIIADTPGHVQYTRNMITGSSRADLVLILIDGRHGMTEQTRRHTFLTSLLRIPHVVVCVNKMDLIDYDEKAFEAVKREFQNFIMKLEIPDVTFIPISALNGDNVVSRSPNMEWYEGSSLLHHLEQLHIGSDRNHIDARFPVQYVIRPQTDEYHDYRGYAGTVTSGVFKVGDEVLILPNGFTSTVASLESFEGPISEAFGPMAITMHLTDDIDISRGDMICRPNNRPKSGTFIQSMICWMSENLEFRPGMKLAIKHLTKSSRVIVEDLQYRINLDTLHREINPYSLRLNEIGRTSLQTTEPLFFDEFRRNRNTGSFILIDEATNATVAAGIIVGSGA